MISLSVPSRGRPKRFAEMYASAKATADGEFEVIAVLDEDDETRKRYPKGPTYVEIPEGPVTTEVWNHGARAATGDIVMLAADDIIFRSQGWDTTVSKAFETWPERIGMVYGNDLHPVRGWYPPVVPGWDPGGVEKTIRMRGGKYWANEAVEFIFPTHPFVSREWIEAAGFFTPPYFSPTWEADNWILLVAEQVGRITYLPDVHIEHVHPMNGYTEVMDELYERGCWAKPELWAKARRELYSGERTAERRAQADRIRARLQHWDPPRVHPASHKADYFPGGSVRVRA